MPCQGVEKLAVKFEDDDAYTDIASTTNCTLAMGQEQTVMGGSETAPCEAAYPTQDSRWSSPFDESDGHLCPKAWVDHCSVLSQDGTGSKTCQGSCLRRQAVKIWIFCKWQPGMHEGKLVNNGELLE